MGIKGLSSGDQPRRLTRAVGVAAAMSALAMASAPAAAASKCHAGVHKFGSAQARTFCGKASAHVYLPGRAATIRQGSCQTTSNYFTINIGTIVLSANAPNPPDYFGITVGKIFGSGTPAGHDGTYKGAAVSFVIKHKRHALLNASVTLKGHRTKGSFSGTLFGGAAVSGTFRCA